MQHTITSTHIIATALGIGAVLSLFASSHPDGLEKAAEDVGFFEHATLSFNTLIPDYVVPGLTNETIAASLAGIIGTLTVGALLFFIGWMLFNASDR